MKMEKSLLVCGTFLRQRASSNVIFHLFISRSDIVVSIRPPHAMLQNQPTKKNVMVHIWAKPTIKLMKTAKNSRHSSLSIRG
uniref:Uncharacterized protein n=1 Tax=Romanomermis culicivorax TaxID=13658 RepID=A0A915I167_ROMCU